MSHNLGVMNAAINLDTRNFDSGVKKATGSLQSFGGTITTLNQGVDLLSRAWRGFDRAVNGTLRTFIQAADQMEKYQITLRNTLGSQREGLRMFREMSKFAQTAPFEYDEIMKSASALSGVMKGGVDEIKEWIPGIADLASVYNMTIEDTTNNVARMYAAGAASAVAFRDRGILAAMGFQQGVTYSVNETRKKVQEYFAQIEGASKDFANTWDGMTSMLSDKWMAFRSMTMDTGLFDHMKERLSDIIEKLNEFQETGQMQVWAKNVAYIFGQLINTMTRSLVGFLKLVMKGAEVFTSFQSSWTELQIATLERREERGPKAPINKRIATWFRGGDQEELAEQYRDKEADRHRREEIERLKTQSAAQRKAVEVYREALEGLDATGKMITLDLSEILNYEPPEMDDLGETIAGDLITPLSKEALAFADTMNAALRKADFDLAATSMQEYEKQLAQINFDLEEMKEKNKEVFQESPEFQRQLDQLGELRRAALEISTMMSLQESGDNFFDSQKAAIEGSETLITNYAAKTEELQANFERFIETNKELFEQFPELMEDMVLKFDELTDELKANVIANEIKGIFDNAQQHFTSFLYEFAQTGKATFKELVNSLMKMLQMMAAQKTAKLLMEAAYQGVMAFISPGEGHGAKSIAALKGASIMGSFVAGSGLAGMAHKGITDIPEDGTWLLKKNERVVDTETNKDLKEYLSNASKGVGSLQVVFNNSDQESVERALPALRRTILDVISGDISNNGQTLKIIRNHI